MTVVAPVQFPTTGNDGISYSAYTLAVDTILKAAIAARPRLVHTAPIPQIVSGAGLAAPGTVQLLDVQTAGKVMFQLSSGDTFSLNLAAGVQALDYGLDISAILTGSGTTAVFNGALSFGVAPVA